MHELTEKSPDVTPLLSHLLGVCKKSKIVYVNYNYEACRDLYLYIVYVDFKNP